MRFEGIIERFPGLCVAEGTVRDLTIQEISGDLEAIKPQVAAKIRSSYTIEGVKDDPVFRAYRDFFWRVGIDPTKIRPASEALVRRILSGKPLPTINTAVDGYNLASALCSVPLAAFDADLLRGGLAMRFAREGETFLGIGMKEPAHLKPNQVILCDAEKIAAIYPYRDADESRVTTRTRNVCIVSCGVPGVDSSRVLSAYRTCAWNLKSYCWGTPEEPTLFP